MTSPRVSDHALVRFLERAGGMDVERLRADLSASLERGFVAAREISGSDFLIRVDGLLYLVRNDCVVSVINDHNPQQHARKLRRRPAQR
ncbi:MAG: hypothetical protein JKX86_02350 [Verrucomicrobiales bacterium]|jgi:hypothetical protein|nr:hypothetical protein [Verrucomicrobiales bacterium]